MYRAQRVTIHAGYKLIQIPEEKDLKLISQLLSKHNPKAKYGPRFHAT